MKFFLVELEVTDLFLGLPWTQWGGLNGATVGECAVL